MVKQDNGKIFKVQDIGGEMVYYGSTNESYLCRRMDSLRSQYNQWKGGKPCKGVVFQIFEKYGIANCVIVLVENFVCDSKDELKARVSFYIQSNECVNKIASWTRSVSDKKYYIKHADEKQKYRDDNKEKSCEYSREYRINNKQRFITKRIKKKYQFKRKRIVFE